MCCSAGCACGAGPARGCPHRGREPPSGPRGRACCPPTGQPMKVGPDSVAPRDSAPLLLSLGRAAVPGDPKVTQAHREREQAQGTLGTAAHSTRALVAGQSRVPERSTTGRASLTGANDTRDNDGPGRSIPGSVAVRDAPWGAVTLPGGGARLRASREGTRRTFVLPPAYRPWHRRYALRWEVATRPANARELKSYIVSLAARSYPAQRA